METRIKLNIFHVCIRFQRYSLLTSGDLSNLTALVGFFHVILVAVVKDLKYADSHEWVKVDGNSATVGITDHAQDHLGDVVYVELPEVGATVTQGDSFGAVESVKATSDVNSPVSGTVIEVNEELSSSPALVSFIDKMCLLSLCALTIFSPCCTF